MTQQHQQRVDRIRQAGYKLTRARLTVLDVLERGGGHMTSADVLAAVEQTNGDIGRASVFRTLDMLTELAIVRPTYVGGDHVPTYVLMPGGHHHHIICTQCQKVIEFEDCGLDALTRRLEAEHGVHIEGHLLEFFGVCRDCDESG